MDIKLLNKRDNISQGVLVYYSKMNDVYFKQYFNRTKITIDGTSSKGFTFTHQDVYIFEDKDIEEFLVDAYGENTVILITGDVHPYKIEQGIQKKFINWYASNLV